MDTQMREFEVPQYYETTIAMRTPDGDIEREFLFLSLPASAIHEISKPLLADPPALLNMLGLDESEPLRVAQLPDAILTLLTDDVPRPESNTSAGPVPGQEWLDQQRAGRSDYALLAEYLAFGEVVPFEQSRAQAAALATKAMKSYALGGWLAGSAGVASAFGPHVAVAYTASAAGAFLAVSVVNSIGVAVGFVSSEKTAAAVGKVRRGFRRLIGGDVPAAAPVGGSAATAKDASTTEQQLRAAEDELLTAERARIDADRQYREAERKLREADQHRRAAEKQAAMKRHARKLIIKPGPIEDTPD